MSCHDGSDSTAANVVTGSIDSFGMASGHSLTAKTAGDVSIDGCSTCHDAHAANSDRPMVPNKKINGVTVASSGPGLCLACHNTDNSWYGPDYPSTSHPTHDATGFPVSGTWPGPDTYNSSTNLHRLIPETTQTVAPGEPVLRQQGDCLYCHAAHGSANAYDSLLATFTVPAGSTLTSDQAEGSYAALCFRCHGGVTPSGFTSQPVDIKRYATATDASAGHSIITSGGTLPVGSPLPCFECHNPHGSKRGNDSMISDERGGSLTTANAAGIRQFCFTCHTTHDTTSGWDSEAQMYVAVSSTSTVVGIPRDGGVLRLPEGGAHDQADSSSCYDCHGNSYAAGGRNVHDPDPASASVNTTTTSASLQTSDTAPPITVADMSRASTGTIVLNAVDLGSGVQATYYSLDGSSTASMGTTVTVSAEGTHTLQFWSVDNAGNVEPANTVVFLVDLTPPVTTSDAQASYVGSATITLSGSDTTGGSGVSATYYQLDGGPETTGTVVVDTDVGSHALRFWSVDGAGNVETANAADFTVTADPSASQQAQTTTPPDTTPAPDVSTPASDTPSTSTADGGTAPPS